MRALNLALEAPERVSGIVLLGVPAFALPGFPGDPFCTAISTLGLRALTARLRPPTTRTARRGMVNVLGQAPVDRTPDEWFELVRRSMGMPGYSVAMRSHLRLAMRRGRPRPENVLGDSELRRIATPVRFLWRKSDVYGGPEIGRRAARAVPDARLETLPGGHAVFLDDPASCARHIGDFSDVGSDAAGRPT